MTKKSKHNIVKNREYLIFLLFGSDEDTNENIPTAKHNRKGLINKDNQKKTTANKTISTFLTTIGLTFFFWKNKSVVVMNKPRETKNGVNPEPTPFSVNKPNW